MKKYSPKEFAKIAGVSVKTLQRWDNNKKLLAYRKPSGRRFYCVDHLNLMKKVMHSSVGLENKKQPTVILLNNQSSNLNEQINNLFNLIQKKSKYKKENIFYYKINLDNGYIEESIENFLYYLKDCKITDVFIDDSFISSINNEFFYLISKIISLSGINLIKITTK